MRRWVILILVALGVIQFIRPGIPSRAAPAEIQVPPPVKQVLTKSCYSCHSDERRLSWFDQIVPGYWLVHHDVLAARRRLNFSTLGSQPPAAQRAALYEAVNMIRLGAMPLPSFRNLHPEARVTPEDRATLEAYLSGSTKPSPAVTPSAGPLPAPVSAPVNLTAVQPEFNGLPLDASFEGWKIISSTERTDNNTLRFILGNDIAVEAAKAGNVSPWPNGARFAKIAWHQQEGTDNLIHTGGFIQVELMTRDARLYKKTDGWGWGRWRGADLKPYGRDAGFVTECTGCHMPVRGNDSVYTLPMTSASAHGDEVVNNRAAALPATLPWQPLEWRPITLYVDPQNHSLAILFGNELASGKVEPRTPLPQAPVYPAGAVLALVTWAERDDPHWFGARIPDIPRSVEFVQVADSPQASLYRRFAGVGLGEDDANESSAPGRVKFILALAPAQLP